MDKKWNIGWGTTSMCNMNCKFCYSKEPREELSDLNIADCKKFILENGDLINSINFGTGENSLLDEWFELVEFIKKNYPRIRMAVTSNGYISDKIEKNLRHKKIFLECIDEVDISLDFGDEEKHNNFRGQRNAYKWATNLLKELKDTDIDVTIVFIGTSQNLYKENIDSLFEIGKKYNAKLRMNVYRPVSLSDELNDQFKVDYSQVEDTLLYIAEKYKVLSLSDPLFNAIFVEGNTLEDPSGTKSLRILPDGSITPSTYLIKEEYRKYKITEGRVLDKVHFEEFVNKECPEACASCTYANVCKGGAIDRRMLYNGTLNCKDPLCPTNSGHAFPTKKIRLSQEKWESVHNDYLPTMFFKSI